MNCKIHNKVDKGESLEKYYASLEDQEVLLRIYNDDYYTDRFLREGLVMRQLEKSHQVRYPKLIDEWPEHQIRAIEWIELSNISQNDISLSTISSWIENQQIDLPYSLQNDLIPHLLNTNNIHSAYIEFYENHLDFVLETIDWDDGPQGLIHGDLHLDNMGWIDDQIIVYDWEYATTGSQWYDLAYFQVLHGTSNTKVPPIWKHLATVVNTHWYLQEDNFSPKEAISWVNTLGKYTI